MFDWTNILFYLAFLSQIYLISYYFPTKVLDRMRYVIETYPPSKYPKLYPKPIEYYVVGQWGFKLATRIIAVLGCVILLAIIFVVDHSTFADDGYISEIWPAFYGGIQFIPLMVLEFSEFGQFKMMRQANTATTRKAALRPRRLFDFVSTRLVVAAVAMYLTVIVSDLYVHEFVLDWGTDTIERAIVLTVTNLLLASMGAWNLYGRKQNPHQALEDRDKQIEAALTSFLYASIAMSIFFMTAVLDDVIDMDFLGATLMSLYFQAITFLSIGQAMRTLKLENIDFDVYKNGTAVT